MPRRATRAFADIVSARTWRASGYFLLAPITGAIWFSITVGGISTVILIPVIALALGAMRFGANLERRLLRSAFGFEIDDPYRPLPDRGFWARLWARLADPATWKDAVYLNLLFPLGLVYLTVTVTLWSLAIGLVSMPAWYWAIPGYPKLFEAQGQAHVIVDTWWKAALALLVGLAIALVTPPILRALAATHRWIARGLLGASEKAKLRARAARLASSRAKAVGSAEAERRRIERDLHDGAQARLVALAMELGRAKEKFETDPAAAQVLVEHAHEEAKATIAELRNLARGIHPAVLTDRGLDAALSSLAARSPVPVRVNVRVGRRPAPEIESIAYFVVAEALTNVAKHAQASEAEVVVARDDERLVVEVRDDGVGGAEARANGGIGGLADRVAAIDGTLTVWSPDGGPTVVRAELPCVS